MNVNKNPTMVRRGALLLQLLDAYAVRYSEMLDGRSEHLPVNELAGGARIRHIFLDIFVNGLQELNPSRRAPPAGASLALAPSFPTRCSPLIRPARTTALPSPLEVCACAHGCGGISPCVRGDIYTRELQTHAHTRV